MLRIARFFGPWPLTYLDFIDAEQQEVLNTMLVHIEEEKLSRPFHLALDKEATQDDIKFICQIMELDPRDRPTAKQLLGHKWFDLP